MGWSANIDDLLNYDRFPTSLQELWAREHIAYPRDADLLVMTALSLGLRSATVAGGRTPLPEPPDEEIVMLSIMGTAKSSDFLGLVMRQIQKGPGHDTAVYKNYAALARLAKNPCQHHFDDYPDGLIMTRRCRYCRVFLNSGMMWFDE
jgi:hypothetical protein